MALTAPSAVLTGSTIASSFDQLLFVDAAAGMTEATLKIVSTEVGKSALSISDEHVLIKGVDTNNAAGFEVQQTDGTSILKVAAGTPSVLVSGNGTKLYFADAGGEYISGSASTSDLTITAGNDIKLAVGAAGSVHSSGSAGTSNTVLGVDAGADLHSGSDFNVFIGDTAADATMTAAADYNVGVGYGALGALTSGTQNVVVGASAGAALLAGGNNVAIGMEAFQDANSSSSCVIIGKKAGADLNGTNVNGTIAIGFEALKVHTTGARNTAIGYRAMDDTDHHADTLTSVDNIFIGYDAGGGTWSTNDSNYNVGIGNYSMDAAMNGALHNTGVGHEALSSLTTTPLRNTAIGSSALANVNTGDDNTGAGFGGGGSITTGSANTSIGSYAMGETGSNAITGDANTAVGYQSGYELQGAAAENTLVGTQSGFNLETGSYNTIMGTGALKLEDTGSRNVAIGYEAMRDLNYDGEGQNVAIGMYAMVTNQVGTENVAIGYNAMGSVANAQSDKIIRNVAIGRSALSSAPPDDDSQCIEIAIGYSAMGAWTGKGSGTDAPGYNLAIGYNALDNNTSSRINIAIGSDSLGDFTRTDNADGYNIGIGHDSGRCLTTGIQNTFVGHYSAGTGAKSLTGHSNTAVGYLSANDLDGAAIGNTCIGKSAGEVITTGSYNTIIGYENEVAANDRAGTVVLGSQTDSGADNTVRIGSTTGYAELLMDGSDTSWAASSDVRLKENIEDSTVGLSFISDLRPITYNWKKKKDVPSSMPRYEEGSDEPYNGAEVKTLYGFVAQEVKEIIDNHELSDGQAIWSEDSSGVQHLAQGALMTMMVKAVQELSQQVEDLKAKIN